MHLLALLGELMNLWPCCSSSILMLASLYKLNIRKLSMYHIWWLLGTSFFFYLLLSSIIGIIDFTLLLCFGMIDFHSKGRILPALLHVLFVISSYMVRLQRILLLENKHIFVCSHNISSMRQWIIHVLLIFVICWLKYVLNLRSKLLLLLHLFLLLNLLLLLSLFQILLPDCFINNVSLVFEVINSSVEIYEFEMGTCVWTLVG